LNFNREFGLKWSDHLNYRLLIFFCISFLLIFSQIIVVANLDYSEYHKKHKTQIIEEYKRLVAELIIEQGQQITKSDSTAAEAYFPDIVSQQSSITPADERINKRQIINDMMGKEGVLNPDLNSNPYAGLPEIEDLVPDFLPDEFIVVELSRKGSSSAMRFQTRRKSKTQYGLNVFDESLDNLYNYVIRRQGNAYINPTEELLKDNQVQFGYRDPDEIQRVIAKYKPMIEHCYRKALDQYGGSTGYVKVQFQISYEGHVIPESIRILSSTIKNRQAEQCIKKYIKRWRNFAELDERMGIARVTQKFVFN
jgi:hypothetical protein